ncbi:MAG: hypothetical protein JW726_05640 [Anaerolineales bacterium]|nr:hypothetical protein [Anaerolineales bacterium]
MPENLRLLACQALEPDEPLEMIFVVPAQIQPKKLGGRGDMHRVPEQALLFTDDRVVHVQADANPEMAGQMKSLRGDQLFYVRNILILLYGRLELFGVDHDVLTSIIVEYNTVAHDLLKPVLQRFLRLGWGAGMGMQESMGDQTAELLDELGQRSYKFGNGLRIYALQRGERLSGFVFQPRIYKPVLYIFQRLVAPASVLALTEKNLILMHEGNTSATSYGWFITICPRAWVAGTETRPNAKWQDVIVHLRMGSFAEDIEMTLESDTAQAWLSKVSNRPEQQIH